MMKKILFLWILNIWQLSCAASLAEQLRHAGYAEIEDATHDTATFDALYVAFDEFINFLHTHPAWVYKIYSAKERFIRSVDSHYYSTDFFGFYDESRRVDRSQIAFYYSTHFDTYVCDHYPEIKTIPELARFFQLCRTIQEPYGTVFCQAAAELGLETVFSGCDRPPVLLKVVKYLPAYRATKPHYDGSVFSLFLDSTDNQSLLVSAYKSTFTVDDFCSPHRKIAREYHQHSILLIPGVLLTEFSLYPTPHIVAHSGNTRYATIAFAMRPHYISKKNECSPLPNFKE